MTPPLFDTGDYSIHLSTTIGGPSMPVFHRRGCAKRARAAHRRLESTRAEYCAESEPCIEPLTPPEPPIRLTPTVASDPDTPIEILWHIARHAPRLRKWVIVNRGADANLLEYISQQGGPGVRETLQMLFDSVERSRA